MSCLEAIAVTHHKECLEVYCELLQQADQEKRTLAGIVICVLIDLKATEAIDTIREAFNRNYVDISISGDLEDVEIALGLRAKRDTPKPNYNDFSPEQLGDDDFEPVTRSKAKVGRNEPCPCGSGKSLRSAAWFNGDVIETPSFGAFFCVW